MSSIGSRFIQLIQHLGLSKNAFAQSLGKTATVIQHLVDERNKPGYDLLVKVFEIYPNVSKDWLMQGKGAMLNDQVVPALPPPTATPELAFEPIEVPAPPRPPRRNGSALQPADIAATLALAASPGPAASPAPDAATRPLPPPPLPAAAPSLPEPSATSAPPAPEANYLAVVLHTQHLQHQLALAELRNQHLLEQQQLMQQLVTVLREQR